MVSLDKANNTFISIIIPVRNEEAKIVKCLDSIVNQDFPQNQFEVLVIDGKSTDNTRVIIQKYSNKYENVFVFDNPEKVVPYAMNLGLKSAKGEIIIRVDGHCYVNDNFIKQNLELSLQTNAECVGGRIESINETFVGKSIALVMSSLFGVGNCAFRQGKFKGYTDTLAFGAYKREVFSNIGLFDPELVRCQDDEFNYRLRRSGGKIYLDPKIVIHYYPRSSYLKLIKQYFQYGFWKVRVFQKHPSMMQPRQFIPALFIGGLILSMIVSIISPQFIVLLISILGLYGVITLLASFLLSLKNGMQYFFISPLIYWGIHFSYGAGFLSGLLYFLNRWKQSEKVKPVYDI